MTSEREAFDTNFDADWEHHINQQTGIGLDEEWLELAAEMGIDPEDWDEEGEIGK